MAKIKDSSLIDKIRRIQILDTKQEWQEERLKSQDLNLKFGKLFSVII